MICDGSPKERCVLGVQLRSSGNSASSGCSDNRGQFLGRVFFLETSVIIKYCTGPTHTLRLQEDAQA